MRPLSGPIYDAWNAGGPYVGSRRTNGVVTVEKDWLLSKSVGAVGTYTKLPIRWYQRSDNSQVETVVPNVKSVSLDKSVDTDAWTATIVLQNQNMMFGVPGELGQPGYFSPDRASSPESRSRWGQTTNEWTGVIVEGALLRTYEGIGGYGLSLADALTAGNLVKTGTWVIDKVRVTTNGQLSLECRNMAGLLVDQPVTGNNPLIEGDAYPDPLIPTYGTDGAQIYPLDYRRFYDRWVSNPYIAYGTAAGGTKHIMGMARGPTEGYWLVGDDGGVFTYGENWFYGSMGGDTILTPPVVGMASAPDGDGYWLVDSSGAVFSFGNVTYLGNAASGSPIVSIQAHPTGIGYYITAADGGVFTFGSAVDEGDGVGLSSHDIVDMAVRPQGDGYWLVSSIGEIYSIGGIPFYGGSPSIGVGTVVGMDVTPSGEGYIITTDNGGVFTFGDAVFHGSAISIVLNDPITDVVIHPDNIGYWLVAEDGGVFTYGNIPFLGSLPGASTLDFPFDGNYFDFSDIIKELLLWAGFWLYADTEMDGKPTVYASIESTGAYSTNPIPPEMFDKKPVIDGIKAIRDIVGYLFYVDDDGAAVFTSPNYFNIGNYLGDGSHTTAVAAIDEQRQLTDYGMQRDLSTLRSTIVVKSANWETGVTEVTTYTPPGAENLRGKTEPVVFNSPIYLTADERLNMARLVSMQIWFNRRVGQVTCTANPLIQPNDQVRIWERQTAETQIHYVRGIKSDHDFETGSYEMVLTTHRLGDEHEWAADLFS